MIRLKIQGQGNYKTTHDLEVIDENTIMLDGEVYEFPSAIVEFECQFPIMEATRSGGVLSVHVCVGFCDDDRNYWHEERPYGQEVWEEFEPGVVTWS